MRIIVQKFGGTSVVDDESRERVSEKIISEKMSGKLPVVVVSAIGRKGAPYATDTLISLAKGVNADTNPRELDLLMACGEVISGVILTTLLESKGHPAVFLTGGQAGILTDDTFGDARILKVQPHKIMQHLSDGKLVVIAGFQGITDDGEVTTLGRGGSDTTASAIGVALKAEVIDIYTDVDGVKTADPRIVDDAKTLELVTYNEVCNLAHEGAKVIHPRAVEIAMQKNIPIRVRSTFSDHPGTLVTSKSEILDEIDMDNYRLITGITFKTDVTQLKIFTRDSSSAKDLQLKIFKTMANEEISVDFINVHPHAVIYTVKDADVSHALDVLGALGLDVEVQRDCAKVSTVGAGMTGIPGVMASIVEALTDEGVEILQSADSYTTIWVLVKTVDLARAVRALHEKFQLNT